MHVVYVEDEEPRLVKDGKEIILDKYDQVLIESVSGEFLYAHEKKIIDKGFYAPHFRVRYRTKYARHAVRICNVVDLRSIELTIINESLL